VVGTVGNRRAGFVVKDDHPKIIERGRNPKHSPFIFLTAIYC